MKKYILCLAFFTGCSFNNNDARTSDSLVYVYKMPTNNTVPLTVTTAGKTADMDISYTYPANHGNEFVVLGLYPEWDNTIYIKTNDIIIDTIVHPVGYVDYLKAEVKNNLTDTPDPFNQDLYFVGWGSRSASICAYDRKGDLRYKYMSTGHFHRVFYSNNNSLYFSDRGGIYSISSNKKVVNYSVTNHHDSIPYNNGYLLPGFSTDGHCDIVLEFNSSGGIISSNFIGDLFWDAAADEDLDDLKMVIFDRKNSLGKATDWAHLNSLVYDDGVLYMSLRNQGVVAATYPKWELLWWMADESLCTSANNVEYREWNFTKIDSLQKYRLGGDGESDGPKNQHALILFENGNIGMFDNQGDSTFGDGGSRYVEYSISTNAGGGGTATKKREYRDELLYSRTMSDADITGDDTLLITWGNKYILREVDFSDNVLFELKLAESTQGIYRVGKMPLYPYDDPDKKYSIDYNEKQERLRLVLSESPKWNGAGQ